MGIPEREEKGMEHIVKATVADIFPNPESKMYIQIPEAQRDFK